MKKGAKPMNAIEFIKDHGVDKAREVVEGVPDKTATHYVFRKIPSYYSIEFQSWYHDGEWWDSDCYTEQDLIDSYGSDFVLSLSDLNHLVYSVDLVSEYGGLYGARDFISGYTEEQLAKPIYSPMLRLKQAIADFESIYSNYCEILDHPEDYTSPNCKKFDERVNSNETN